MSVWSVLLFFAVLLAASAHAYRMGVALYAHGGVVCLTALLLFGHPVLLIPLVASQIPLLVTRITSLYE